MVDLLNFFKRTPKTKHTDNGLSTSIRELANLAYKKYWERRDIEFEFKPHLNASKLPCITEKNAKDNNTSTHYLNESWENPSICLRNIVLSAAGIQEWEEYAMADIRNFERGRESEYWEVQAIKRGIELSENPDDKCEIIYRLNINDADPLELKLLEREYLGIPITGRCDALVRKNGKFIKGIEMKSPRSASFNYDNLPKLSNILQAGWYSMVLNIPFDIYLRSGGDSQYGLWTLENKTDMFTLYNDIRTSTLRLEKWRMDEAIKLIVPHIFECYELFYKKTPDLKTIKNKLQTIPCTDNTKRNPYPCKWNKGITKCGYYSYCYEDNSILKFKGVKNGGQSSI